MSSNGPKRWLTLATSLPDVEDTPPEMHSELMQMTWLSDQELWNIAKSQFSEDEEAQLAVLSEREDLDPDRQEMLEQLRQQYGQITLRKARAYALLSLRAGIPLLSSPS